MQDLSHLRERAYRFEKYTESTQDIDIVRYIVLSKPFHYFVDKDQSLKIILVMNR